MTDPALPNGPMPDAKDIVPHVESFIRAEGAQNLTLKALRKRLESIFSVNLEPYKKELQEVTSKVMATPEFQQQLAKANKAKQEGLVAAGKGKGKKSASKEPAAKKDKSAKAPKEAKVAKAKKPDDYPKAALSDYFLFMGDQRPALIAANPGVAAGKIGGMLGDLWKSASEETKAAYKTKAIADKARFEEDMKAYLAAGGEVFKRSAKGGKKEKKAKKVKDPNAPKRSVNAYFIFSTAKRSEAVEKAGTNALGVVAKVIKSMWDSLSETDRAVYDDAAKKDRERYDRECAEKGIKVKPAAVAGTKRARSASSSSGSSSSGSSSSDSDSSSSSDSD